MCCVRGEIELFQIIVGSFLNFNVYGCVKNQKGFVGVSLNFYDIWDFSKLIPEMESRMRRQRQLSPERAIVWSEKSPKYRYNHHHNKHQQQKAKVPVVYYLCRNSQLEHPHFMEVPLTSPDGLYLRGIKKCSLIVGICLNSSIRCLKFSWMSTYAFVSKMWLKSLVEFWILLAMWLILDSLHFLFILKMWSKGLIGWEAEALPQFIPGLARGKMDPLTFYRLICTSHLYVFRSVC